MPNKSPARILRDVKRITKFVSQKRPKPSLSITFVNRIEIPPIPKLTKILNTTKIPNYKKIPKITESLSQSHLNKILENSLNS